MRFDSIVIGGGLSGLVCALELQRRGRNCAIVSAGQSTLHFNCGSFGLLGALEDGTPVKEPLKALAELSTTHPYSVIGHERTTRLAEGIPDFFASHGIVLKGNAKRNGLTISHLGGLYLTAFVSEDAELLPTDIGTDAEVGPNVAEAKFNGRKALVVNFEGYHDFNSQFIVGEMLHEGMTAHVKQYCSPRIALLRKSPSEMRAVAIGRVMAEPAEREALISWIKSTLRDEDLLILPAVFGLKNADEAMEVKSALPVRTILVGTMPPSVPGSRMEWQLTKAFTDAGGTLLRGDAATHAELDGDRIEYILTEKLGDTRLEADDFVLASGSFISRGLWATRDRVYETLLGLDTIYSPDREEWCDEDFFASQDYLRFGVSVDSKLRPSKDGMTIHNLRAIGSLLGGCNTLKTGCGAGVAIVTALAAAEEIIGSIHAGR